MKNTANRFKDYYFKKHPVTALSTFCVILECAGSILFIERVNFVSLSIVFLTLIIFSSLHEELLDELKDENRDNDWR